MVNEEDANLPSGHHWQWNPEEKYFMAVENGTYDTYRPKKHKNVKEYGWYREIE